MSKTNRDRVRNNHSNHYDEDENADIILRKDSKRKRKKNRRSIDQSLKELVRNGDYDLDEELFLIDD